MFSVKKAKYYEDDRAQRLFDLVECLPGQINVSFINSVDHIVAWHMHPKEQIDYWCCLKGSMKVGLVDQNKNLKWEYLSDKNFKILKIEPGIWHGYKALQSETILLYYVTKKWNLDNEIRCSPGSFGEDWEIENK